MTSDPAPVPPPALAGVRVIDLTTTLSGPYCTLLLAELGAEVIKIETPGGDIVRYVGPARTPGMGSIFLALNRGKRSVVLDLKTPEGRSALERLIDTADVVVHNMRAPAARRLGIDGDTVLARNPRAVHCAINGYASDSPAADSPAYDDIIQGDSGMAALQGRLAGEPGYVASAVVDKTAGLVAYSAILAALLDRERSGAGQSVEVPMLDVTVATTLVEHLAGATFDPPLGPALYTRTISRHRHPYRTADAWICVLVYTEQHWERFLTYIGRAELLEDERYGDVASRIANVDDLYVLVAETLLTKTTEEWLGVFEQIDVPAARLREPDDVIADPDGLLTGMFFFEDHPTEGRVRTMAHPVRYGGRRPPPVRHAARLGADTDEVLGGLDPGSQH